MPDVQSLHSVNDQGDFSLDVARCVELHHELAGNIKRYEQQLSEFPTEVLNELRYALRASIELLSHASFDHLDDDQRKDLDYLEERLHHALTCAHHDLVDGLVVELAAATKDLMEAFPEATLEVMGDKRLELLSLINAVTELVAKTRSVPEDRRAEYNELYEEHFADLIEKWKFLKQTIVPEVYEHEGRLEKKRKRARFERWISWTVAAIGLAIGMWGLFF